MSTTTKITDVFPHKTLTKCSKPLTLANVLKIKQQIYANASAVKSEISHGNYGHLGQVMPEEDYLQLNNVIEPWVTPIHPGRWPPPGRRIVQGDFDREYATYTEAKEVATTCANLDSALIALMVEAIDEDDISELRCPHTGAYNTTARAMLAHITATFSYLSEADLQAEANKIRTLNFDPDTMEVGAVFTKLNELQQLATAAGNEFTDQQLIQMGVDVFRRSGHFGRACDDWKTIPAANRTITSLSTHFKKHHANIKENNPEGVGTRYGTQLANLAQKTDETTAQMQDITNIYDDRLTRLEHLLLAVVEQKADTNNTESNSGTINPQKKKKKKKNKFGEQAGNAGNPNKYYCYAHGSQNSHPSAHCRAKEKFVHFCDDATFEDKKGGCTLIARSS